MLHAVAKTKESDESEARVDPFEERARQRLKSWIDASGYSVTEVADLAGIPQANLARYVSGKSPVPLSKMEDLAAVFGRKSTADFTSETCDRPLTRPELDAAQPMFAKHRPGFVPTAEDLADFQEYVRRVQARREKKLKTKR